MRQVWLITGVLMLGLSEPLAAEAINCVTIQRCTEGVKPPACCKPPPCEIYEQIKMKQAVKGLFSRPKMRQRLIRRAGGDNAKAAKMLNDFVNNKASNLGKYLRCSWQGPYLPPPSFETNSSCQIIAKLSTGAKPMGRESALSNIDTCSEFIEAAYDHEQVHKDICFNTNSTERANMGITAYAAEERAGYTKELQSLRASLQEFWNACSSVADAKTKRQVAAAGISTLKKKSPKKPAKSAKAG
ncbi:MAG: hypothetical protein WCH04_22430 [Gammaproteobacteria bacterium]